MKSTEEKTPKPRLIAGRRSALAKQSLKKSVGKDRARTRLQLRAQVLETYKLRAADVDLAPKISAILDQAKGGLDVVLDAMRFSNSPSIVAWLKTYDAAESWERRHMPWEGWALVAGVEPNRLLADVMQALRESSVSAVKVLAITHHPEVMKARIRAAKRPEGVRDRDALDRGLGFLPQPKGPTFIGNVYQSGGAHVESEPSVDPGDVDMDDLFPSLGVTQKLLGS